MARGTEGKQIQEKTEWLLLRKKVIHGWVAISKKKNNHEGEKDIYPKEDKRGLEIVD